MSVPALAVDDVSVRYGGRQALASVSFAIAPGDVFGLLGANGAGKSTLIRALVGRVATARGRIRIAGLPPCREASRRIGIAPQEIALYPRLTVRENLGAFARLAGLDRATTTAAVRDAAEATGLDPRLDERVERLSGGWKRRVNVAAAVTHRPALLILDEPTAGCDAAARAALHAAIRTLAAAGVGVLLTTHDMEEAERLCDRVGFLIDGRIATQGAPHALVAARFGGRVEFTLAFDERPSERNAAALRDAGYRDAPCGRVWRRLAPASDALAADAAGDMPGLRERRIRAPGLDTLARAVLTEGAA